MKSGTILSVLTALLLTTGLVLAQTGHDYRLTWSSLDGGGATFSSDGQYSLGGTIGQPDAGMLTRGKYSLVSGFWGAAGLMAPVEPSYGVEVTPAVQTRAGQPGVTVAYTLQVRCIGNVADTYDVAVSGNAWPAHAPATVGPLAAGEGQAMEVTVEIPGAAAYGASDTATINVTSQGDAAQSASATLTTIVRPAELFLPLILK